MTGIKSAAVIRVTEDIYRVGLVPCCVCSEAAAWWVMAEREQSVTCSAHLAAAAADLMARRRAVTFDVRVGRL